MKGTLNVNGLEVKYKTIYYENSSLFTNHKAIDVKYKIINIKGYWFYRKCEVACEPEFVWSPSMEEYRKELADFNNLLTMSQEEFEKVLIKIIQDDIDRRLNEVKRKYDKMQRSEAFNKKFN